MRLTMKSGVLLLYPFLNLLTCPAVLCWN
ncbi:hypothetical protein LINPERPRIM_LOCUS6573 [Linum perenne]